MAAELARCYGCGVTHTYQPDDYRVCGECGHLFRTEQDLIDATKRLFVEMGFAPELVTGSGGIYSCPQCTHDW